MTCGRKSAGAVSEEKNLALEFFTDEKIPSDTRKQGCVLAFFTQFFFFFFCKKNLAYVYNDKK